MTENENQCPEDAMVGWRADKGDQGKCYSENENLLTPDSGVWIGKPGRRVKSWARF